FFSSRRRHTRFDCDWSSDVCSSDLTLDHTTVSDNRVGSASGLSTLASDAQGGAITSWLDVLTIRHSVIAGNVAGATAPNGRFAEIGRASCRERGKSWEWTG